MLWELISIKQNVVLGELKNKHFFILLYSGGGIGSILGMYAFRHKNKKMYFVIGMPVITIAEGIFIVYYLIKYGIGA